MKRIIIVLVSFLLIAGMCVYCRVLVSSVKTELCDRLQEIEAAAQNEDKELCALAAGQLVEEAAKAGQRLGRFYPHIYGEELKETCREIKYCIEEERWSLLSECIAECRYVLEMIVMQEEVVWENIF